MGLCDKVLRMIYGFTNRWISIRHAPETVCDVLKLLHVCVTSQNHVITQSDVQEKLSNKVYIRQNYITSFVQDKLFNSLCTLTA